MVDRTALRNSVFLKVYNTLLDNVVDPSSRNKKWIYSSQPVYDAPSFTGFPLIIISPVRVTKEYELLKDDNPNNSVNIVISVLSVDSLTLDTVSDSVDNAIVPSNFSENKIMDGRETTGDQLINGQIVHVRSHTYLFDILDYG